jgi:hypothetical protein
MRDRHSGCVGAYLVERDLFDLLLLSLPDNDNHSHRNGPYAQADSISDADHQIGRLVAAAGGDEPFLERYAVIVVADHSHAAVERAVSLADEFSQFAVLQPGDPDPERAQIALCPAQRSAMIYLFDDDIRAAVIAQARTITGVDLVMWREGGDAVIAGEHGVLRFTPGDDVADPRGLRWHVSGDVAVLGARIEDGVLRSEQYPDALCRVWDALACPTSGEILLSAAPAYEFTDWGGAHHVGGGSHGSLHASDSLAPLICWGLEHQPQREQWSIRDVAGLVTGHFGLES